MKISEIMSPQRIELAMQVASKKRALELLSEILATDTGLDSNALFQTIIERERIGSTGIGDNVAIPHGRMKGLNKAVGAFAILEKQIDFDSIDQKPVKMIFALIVPEEATEEHLQLLAQLARIFSSSKAKEKLLAAGSPEKALEFFKDYNPDLAAAK